MPKAFDPTDRLSAMLRAVADPTRRRILQILREKQPRTNDHPAGLCASDIEERLRLAQPTVSHHLGVLKSAGLIESEKQAQWIWFKRNEDGIRRMAKGLREQI